MHRGILASREELSALKGRSSRKAFQPIYRALRQRCALILECPPVEEAQWRNLWQNGNWASAVKAARTVQGRILDLLISHHIDPNRAYRDRAIEELDSLVRWSTWVDPCHGPLAADLCTAEAAVAAVLALDWLWEDLDRAQRSTVLQAVRRKALQPYAKAVADRAWWYGCYHSWNALVNSGCGLAALALADDGDDGTAGKACERALAGLKHFFAALGREGGWDEGPGYWGYAMRYLLLFGEALSRLRDDQHIFHQRGMSATGLFCVYFSPNGRSAGFGDGAPLPLYGALYLLTRYFNRRELLWWLDTYAFQHDVISSGWAAAGLALLFRPERARTPRKPKLEPVKAFREVGWAAMADHWPKPAFYVAAKTGDLSANHSQRDMNSIQLQVDGEMLLVDLGSAAEGSEKFSDAREAFYEVQARAHNTIIVAERDHQIDAHGQVIASSAGDHYRWVACDAKTACGENAQFIRHLVMVLDAATGAGRALLVLDELNNGVPERVDLFWHTRAAVTLDAEKMTGTLTGRRATLAFALASTVGATVATFEHSLGRGRVDRGVCLTAGTIGPELFASAFIRGGRTARLQLRRTADGRATMKLGRLTARFEPARGHLKLASVETVRRT